MTKSSGRCFIENKARSQRRAAIANPDTRQMTVKEMLNWYCLLALCACLCVWRSPDSVCQGSVMITDCGLITALLRRFSWHRLHWPWPVCVRVCVVVCLCMCIDVWVFVAALSDQPWLCPLRVCQPGVTFFLCVSLGMCTSCAAGRESPCLRCARELEGTPRSSVFGWVGFILGVPRQSEKGWSSTSVSSDFYNVCEFNYTPNEVISW